MTKISHRPTRMDGYIRVSRVGVRDVESESYITEDVQRDKIETWAKLRGVEIAAWHVDRDASGAKLSRPGFDACMARIAAGKTDGIVVAQIDRLSRADVADALMIVRKVIDDHGGQVAAVDLGIDPTTEVGEMLLTVLLALARMQWRRYSAAWATAKDRAIKRGAHIGPTPLGYARGKDGRLVPDPKTRVAVEQAFKIAGSMGVSAAAEFLRGAVPGRHWTTATTRRILTNRTYLGEVRNGEGAVNREAHEPLVDFATWTLADLAARGVAGRSPRAPFPLSGVVSCSSCGGHLTGVTIGKGQRGYACRRNKTRPVERGEVERCPAPAVVLADSLEEYVQAALLKYVATERPEEVEVLVEGSDSGDVEAAVSALRSAEMARERDVSDLRLRDVLGDEAFYDRMAAHGEAIEEAQDAYEAILAEAAEEVTWPLTDEVATAEPADLPRLLERTGVQVDLAPGRGNIPERVHFFLA